MTYFAVLLSIIVNLYFSVDNISDAIRSNGTHWWTDGRDVMEGPAPVFSNNTEQFAFKISADGNFFVQEYNEMEKYFWECYFIVTNNRVVCVVFNCKRRTRSRRIRPRFSKPWKICHRPVFEETFSKVKISLLLHSTY